MSATLKEHVTLKIDGTPFEVVSLNGEESISRLFRFEIVCAAEAGAQDLGALIAAEAAITLHDSFGTERTVSGIVAEATERVSDEGGSQITVVVRPHAYTLTLGRSLRVFQSSTVVDIVKKIVAGSAQKSRWELVSTYKPHEYCAEYREDDWSFAMRMLEEEGIYYWFDHEGGQTTLVFDDASASAPDLAGGADIVYAYESGLHAEREIIEELGSRVEVTPSKWTIGSFNHQKPMLKVTGSVGGGLLEVYDAPGGGPDTPEGCARRATIMREAAGAAGAGVSGLSSSVRLVPGMVMNIVGHPLARLEGRYLLTRVTYQVVQRRRDTDAGAHRPYICRFDAIPHAVPFRPPAEAQPAKQPGLQTGIVIGAPGDEVYPDATGRVRVQLRWDREGGRDDKSGKWMRVAQRGTAESMLLPRTGWNVLTFNEEGEIDAPNVLSRIHDAEHPPTYTLPANKTRVVFKTATTPGGGSFNEIYFEDKKGAEEMFINASKDMTVYAQQVKTEAVTRDSLRVVGVNHQLTVGQDWMEHVYQDQTVSIGANEEIRVSGNRKKEVKQSETATVGGNRTISTGYMHTISTKLTRALNVGSAVIETTTGAMSTVAGDNLAIAIGASDLKISKKSIIEDVGKISTQVVGGAKIEIAALDQPTDVGKKLTETVAGSMLLKSDEAFLDGAVKTSAWTIVGAMNSDAPQIYVEALEKIELRCGGSVITILPDSVEICAPSFDLSGARHIEIKTKKIEHN
jgi:type VI secretion system secreted protein VgrG